MTDRVDYDKVADGYDQRWIRSRYDGVAAALLRFIGGLPPIDAVEVGCGTGHWLVAIRDRVRTVTGLDVSMNMLRRARAAAPSAHLVRGRAEQLPWAAATFDRIYCVNALHHFHDAEAFIGEARRVLRPGGALLTIGLDPHTRRDSWWVYDYFPSTLETDRARFRPTSAIRERLEAAGFVNATTELAQHMPLELPFAEAMQHGLLNRSSNSQLLILSDAEYQEGLRRLEAEQPTLRADLRLYATVAYLR